MEFIETLFYALSVISSILGIIGFFITISDLIKRPRINKPNPHESAVSKSNPNTRFALIKFSFRAGFQSGLLFGIMFTTIFPISMAWIESDFNFYIEFGIIFWVYIFIATSIFFGIGAAVAIYFSYRKYYGICDEIFSKDIIIFNSPASVGRINPYRGWLFLTDNKIIFSKYIANRKIDDIIFISDINSVLAINKHTLSISTYTNKTLKFFVSNSAYDWANIIRSLQNGT